MLAVLFFARNQLILSLDFFFFFDAQRHVFHPSVPVAVLSSPVALSLSRFLKRRGDCVWAVSAAATRFLHVFSGHKDLTLSKKKDNKTL